MDKFGELLGVAWEILLGAIWYGLGVMSPLGVAWKILLCAILYGLGVMSPLGLQHFKRRRLRKPVEKAYMNLRRVVEPETMDPSNPGNAAYMRASSRDEINLLQLKLNRANFTTPPPMDLTDESARDWFWALGFIRTKT